MFITREVLDDLGELREQQPDSVYLQIFDRFRGEILDGVRDAAGDPGNYDERGRLYVRRKDLKRFRR